MNIETIKGIVRGDYLTPVLNSCVNTLAPKAAKNEHKRMAICIARVAINTLLVFAILAPLAFIAKPLIAISLSVALIVFVASAILNHENFKNSTFVHKAKNMVNDGVDAVTGLVDDLVESL